MPNHGPDQKRAGSCRCKFWSTTASLNASERGLYGFCERLMGHEHAKDAEYMYQTASISAQGMNVNLEKLSDKQPSSRQSLLHNSGSKKYPSLCQLS